MRRGLEGIAADAGAAVIDEVEALVYRRDLSLASGTLHRRGARIVVLPFGEDFGITLAEVDVPSVDDVRATGNNWAAASCSNRL